MGKNFRVTLEAQLQDPEFKREWDALEPEFQAIKAMLDAEEEMGETSATPGRLAVSGQAR